MKTQQLPPFVRFAHSPNTLDTKKCPYSGLTICYIREDEQVLFTYALCSKDDEYSKKIGRDKTINTWAALMDIPDIDVPPEAIAFVDQNVRAGVIGVGMFKEIMHTSGAFSDQLVDSITMYDFKHAYISHMLVEYVTKEVVLSRFPNSRV